MTNGTLIDPSERSEKVSVDIIGIRVYQMVALFRRELQNMLVEYLFANLYILFQHFVKLYVNQNEDKPALFFY